MYRRIESLTEYVYELVMQIYEAHMAVSTHKMEDNLYEAHMAVSTTVAAQNER